MAAKAYDLTQNSLISNLRPSHKEEQEHVCEKKRVRSGEGGERERQRVG